MDRHLQHHVSVLVKDGRLATGLEALLNNQKVTPAAINFKFKVEGCAAEWVIATSFAVSCASISTPEWVELQKEVCKVYEELVTKTEEYRVRDEQELRIKALVTQIWGYPKVRVVGIATPACWYAHASYWDGGETEYGSWRYAKIVVSKISQEDAFNKLERQLTRLADRRSRQK